MAELIDAARIRTEVDELFWRKYISPKTMVTMKNIIDGQPTVTEAEIRAKAIDDFVEHINLPLTTEEDITKILDQLKGE